MNAESQPHLKFFPEPDAAPQCWEFFDGHCFGSRSDPISGYLMGQYYEIFNPGLKKKLQHTF
jgi:hypothetical protein